MLRKILTLVLILQDEKILLGMKKRGFGAGRWNGFGGEVREDESIEDAAKREVKEECGLEIKRLEEVGVHEFEFVKERGTILEVHVFRGLSWQGEPFETEEMRPKWFLTSKIPYQDMWPDDILWLPTFLEGKKFRTKFLFGDGDQVLGQKIEVVT